MTRAVELDEVVTLLGGFDGVLDLAPGPGGPFPPIAWGDHFFYYATDGEVPQREQPFATIVTKDYPDEPSSGLDAPGRWRVNIHVDRATFEDLVGSAVEAAGESGIDDRAADTVLPHPVYAAQNWVAVVNPGERTGDLVGRLLRDAYDAARRRSERRRASD